MPSSMVHLIHTLFPKSVLYPDILMIDLGLVLGGIGLVVFMSKTHRWGWLWREWITTVDHKKIAIMYLLSALLMLFRGGVDAEMLRAQLAMPQTHFMPASQYDAIFTTHGTIMVFFMAMPFIFALFNAVVPLMIGARDVAFPRLNALSYWLFAFGAILFNISFVIGGSPNAGWTAYPPYTETMFTPGPGQNYYFLAILIAGIGTTITGINFLVTTIRMRAPGMTLMRTPMFIWSVMVTAALIIFAFPPLTVALAMNLFDRLFGSAFFTLGHGGMPMMYVNLFWLFGHPEVYILVIPLFGVFSEVVATYSRKQLFGYPIMVVSIVAIMFLSYGTWVHHFFTMGAGPGVNVFFGLSTMLIAIPTGVKIFNWIFTMWGGRIQLSTAMLYQLAFIPTFVVGGATGVMLGVVPADYQFHNSYFLIAHFHNVIIGGTVFGLLSALYHWWPKMFGMKLNEKQGKLGFWLFLIGFWVTFTPQYLLGLKGMTRRLATYPAGLGWHELNVISTVGALIMGAAFVALVYNIVWSVLYGERDLTGDPWDGRTLEWALPSPAPAYNFARIPVVQARDAWWDMKEKGQSLAALKPEDVLDIEMPKNTPIPFFIGACFFVVGFGLTFKWWPIAIAGFAGVVLCLIWSGFDFEDHHHVKAESIRLVESSLGRLQG